MIPKVINYCWFGNKKKPKSVLTCIESWKKYCPDYKIIEWNENNYDISKSDFMIKAYENEKYAFVSDYARLDIIYEFGGIYLDTDVELIKSLDSLLDEKFYAGFENNEYVAFGLGFGAIKNHPYILEMLDYYNKIDFNTFLNNLIDISCPKIQTEILLKNGLIRNGKNQKLNHGSIYSIEYFCPLSFSNDKLNVTDNTISIHHYSMNWLKTYEKCFRKIEWSCAKIFGGRKGRLISVLVLSPIKTLIAIRKRGLKGGCVYFKENARYYIKLMKNK